MIRMTAEQAEAIRRHGEADYPHECCGLLIGGMEGGVKTVAEVLPISNAREEEAKRNRFLITPQELMRGEKHARASGREVVGFYHSHPDCAATPSQFDLDHAWPVYSYVIVSVRAGKAAEVLSWEMREDRTGFEAEVLG